MKITLLNFLMHVKDAVVEKLCKIYHKNGKTFKYPFPSYTYQEKIS